MPVHVLTKTLFGGRSGWPPRFLAASAWIIGARARVTGERVRPRTLLISNHLSWLDILVLGGSTGTAFVSKDNLGHGLFHWLADQNSTLYIRRDDRKGSKGQALAIAKSAEGKQPIAVFPEGTTGPGDHMLPFRSSLLEAASFASPEVEVRPVALDYGAVATEIAWHNEPGRENILRILGRRGTLPVTIHLLERLDRSGNRKALAQEAREAIAKTLASSPPSSPLYPDAR